MKTHARALDPRPWLAEAGVRMGRAWCGAQSRLVDVDPILYTVPPFTTRWALPAGTDPTCQNCRLAERIAYGWTRRGRWARFAEKATPEQLDAAEAVLSAHAEEFEAEIAVATLAGALTSRPWPCSSR